MPTRSPRVLVIAAFLLGAVFGALGLVMVRPSSTHIAQAQPAAGAATCNNASLDGAYGAKVEGVVLSGPDGTPLANPVPIDLVGAVSADGAGNTGSVDTVDRDGAIRQGSGSGSYTVNSNCTFSLTSTFTLTGTHALTVHLVGVIVDGGKKAYLIDDDSGIADLQITLERQ